MLEALARGLRASGGVLSPNVSQQLAQEGLQDQVAQRQMAMQMFQQKIADDREKALANAVGPALQGGDFEAAARAAAGSGAPGGTQMAMNLLGQVEAREARKQQALLTHQQRVSEITMRTQAELQRARENRESQERIASILEAGRAERANADREFREWATRFTIANRPQPQPVQPQMVTTDAGVFQVDRSGNAVPVVGPDGPLPGRPKQERSLPGASIRELSEAGGTATDFNRLSTNFQDGFAGFGSEKVGDIDNWIKRNFTGDKSGQAQWWQDYQNQKNIVRNKLFGSALTATEKTEFDKAQINPGMRADEIRKNLARQQESSIRAAKKLAGAYAKGGYSPEQIEAALGMPLADLGISAPSQRSSGTVPPADPLGIR